MPLTDQRSPPTLALPDAPGVAHRYVEARGTVFHVAEAGEGPPLLLLHGWPQHWWSWREVIGPLAEEYRVICPDVRGLGWSLGSEGSYRWDDLAEDVVAVMDALDIDRARVMGHDWGLVTGYRACLMHPQRFERFVALAGLHMWQGLATSPAQVRGAWHVWTLAAVGARGVGRLGLAERALEAWRHAGAFSEDEAATYLGTIHRPSTTRATVAFDRATTFYEVWRLLRRAREWTLATPTLHLLGARDPLTPNIPRNFASHARDMRMEEIPDCGHFIAEERPDALLEAVRPFLRAPA